MSIMKVKLPFLYSSMKNEIVKIQLIFYIKKNDFENTWNIFKAVSIDL